MTDARRAAAEKARAIREQQVRRRRLRGLLIGLASTCAALAVVALVVVLVVKGAPSGASAATPHGFEAGGFTVPRESVGFGDQTIDALPAGASDPVRIEIWVDYLCPYCGQFERANRDRLAGWVASGAATVTVHPIAVLDRLSMGTRYSTRAANAAACVAQYAPDSFWDFSGRLFEFQPEENTSGIPDAALLGFAEQSGLAGDGVRDCVETGRYSAWVGAQTAFALSHEEGAPGVDGTPFVLVEGQRYRGSPDDAEAFTAFVLQASER